jgi:outer membrane receptor protein involved in Fe transport
MWKIFYRIITLSILTFLVQTKVFSQQVVTSSISGHVIDTNTQAPVFGCAVVIVELNLWTTTNDKGYYKIDKILTGREYTIATSSLGMGKFEKKILFSESKEYKLDILIKEVSFEMEEVVILAEEKSGLGSSSNIQKTAIDHLQPTSLKDVMQLLPGQVSSNPNLSNASTISIRDIAGDNNSSFGTAILVDGSPVSNNSNLQSSLSTGGVDVRQISTDNIESVEIIRGIASVAYGDMTSGAVIVKTKSGATPLNAKLTLNPNMKKAYLGKGFNLNNNRGAVNFDVDYTSSVDSKINSYKGFDRISAQLGYSNTYMRATVPLTFNIKGKYTQTVDSKKADPDVIRSEEELTSSEYGYKVNMYGKWGLKKKLISNLNYNFSVNLRNQESFSKKLVSSAIQAITNARTDTLIAGVYVPSEYYSEMTVKGKPFDIFAKITGDAILRKGNVLNKVMYGIDYRSNGNNGDGKVYDELLPPRSGGSNSTRPRPFSDIPSFSQYSIFLEDNLTLPIRKTVLFVQAGMRYNNFQPESIFKSKLKTSFEPRINLKYHILNSENNSLFDNLSIFGGYGIQSKSPSINYIYPDNAYFDMLSLNYFPENNDERLVLVSTRVLERNNDDLEPIEVTKYDAGIDGKIKKFHFLFNGYYEKSDNGISFSSQIDFLDFSYWDPLDPNIIKPEGVPPIVDFSNPTRIDTFMAKLSKPVNNKIMIKKGLEYRFDFGKIKAIKTSININGGYLYTKNYTNTETQLVKTDNGAANQLPYVAVYAAGSGKERTRFNSNIIAITHIPKLRLVFTTTLQIIWKNTTKIFYGGEQYTDYSDPDNVLVVNEPIALIDKNNVRYDVSSQELRDMTGDDYLKYIDRKRPEYFYTEDPPVHYQLNLKVTSEIGSKAKFSFFANNFTMHHPKYRKIRTNEIVTLNSSLFFGLELTFIL